MGLSSYSSCPQPQASLEASHRLCLRRRTDASSVEHFLRPGFLLQMLTLISVFLRKLSALQCFLMDMQRGGYHPPIPSSTLQQHRQSPTHGRCLVSSKTHTLPLHGRPGHRQPRQCRNTRSHPLSHRHTRHSHRLHSTWRAPPERDQGFRLWGLLSPSTLSAYTGLIIWASFYWCS